MQLLPKVGGFVCVTNRNPVVSVLRISGVLRCYVHNRLGYLLKFAVASVTNAENPSFETPADTYAVVDIGGHQLIVEEGRWYTVNRLDVEAGSKIQLGRVLALKSNGEFKVGQPYLDGVSVEAEIMEEMKGPKVVVYKMKPKKHYRRTNGHRQPLTKFLVTKISK